MLSYRHGFHAGNFADVLKHSVLVFNLKYLTQKDKPLRYIDTHAGAGSYRLTGAQAMNNREYRAGIGRLWECGDLPPMLAAYVDQVKSFNPEDRLSCYPGSPLLAQRLLRPGDRLFLHELHSTDCRLLQQAMGRDARVSIREEDGFAGLQSLLPPRERRALVLMDPSYEIKSDYRQVVQQLHRAWQRFPAATFALWYPVVSRQRVDELERALVKSGMRHIQLFELGVAPDSDGHGMTGSGMVLINPPWTLRSAVEDTLPWLADVLAGADGYCRVLELVPE